MPIKPANRDRYPADWPEISKRIRQRARWRCEAWLDADGQPWPDREPGRVRCNAENLRRILRSSDRPHLWIHFSPDGDRIDGAGGAEDAHLFLDTMPLDLESTVEPSTAWSKPVVVILTVAHLDHAPENCQPDNLRAFCQRCHLVYDSSERSRMARLERDGQLALTLEGSP